MANLGRVYLDQTTTTPVEYTVRYSGPSVGYFPGNYTIGGNFSLLGSVVGNLPVKGTTSTARLDTHQAVQLTSANFINPQNTGWGGAATITSVSGTDQAWTVTVTASGTPTANPYLTLTYAGGQYNFTPVCISKVIGGTGAIAPTTDLTQSTSDTVTYQGTPVSGKTYTISTICLGI